MTPNRKPLQFGLASLLAVMALVGLGSAHPEAAVGMCCTFSFVGVLAVLNLVAHRFKNR